ncbi:hypothetical protein C1646_819566 [Rhizophagus diaphanus]|nr:hypothetical protein C1646_819566 [Rhizophagus diaphanus] [Rhizophagus sp. MUCL 43196]
MSCSKIFSGDLPELVYEIIKNFQNDYSTLHSCVLVNRLWCRLAIPLLWENPFSITTGNYNFIEKWLEANDKTSNSAIDLVHNIILMSVSEFKKLINMSIVKLFIENENHCKSMLLIKNQISQIINLHQNLKLILFVKAFENLNVLESVHIIYCSSLDGFIQQIINLTKQFKLKSLFMSMILQIDSLQSLLQKYGNYLENFRYESYKFGGQQQFLELIIKYCRNIKFLGLTRIESHVNHLMFSLIENIKQNLNHLTINVVHYQDDLILRNLGQLLPSKLESLSLVLYMIKTNDFEVFLKNSQDTFFKKLSINNLMQEYSDDIDILPYIKKYIMKKKRVKYLAIKNTSSTFSISKGKDVDLSNLKDEVNEFKLYNIKVLKYVNISTDIYRFVNEID